MTREEAFQAIVQALELTGPGKGAQITVDTELVRDGVVDSLDSMNFLFELETLHGAKLEAIDETFDDFRVSRLIDILVES